MDITPAHKLAASRLFLTKEDVDDIIMLVNMLGEEPRIVDLGAGSGTTALAVLQTNPNAIVTSIDISQDNLHWAEKNLIAFNIDISRYQTIRSDASRMHEDIESVDLLLHDADHSEEAVRKDLHAWMMTCLNAGALIWVHDYLPMPGAAETYPGVKKICDELVAHGHLEQMPTTGIGFAARVL